MTVERILDATAAVIDERGVDGVTTRSICDRANVTPPSLYRFFADRDQVLNALVQRHLGRLSAFVAESEHDSPPRTLDDFIGRELEVVTTYYGHHPNAARLWFGGRVSAAVRAEVVRYNKARAERLHDMAVGAGFATPKSDPLVFRIAVELGDRILDLAFREGPVPDRQIIKQGRIALVSYIQAVVR